MSTDPLQFGRSQFHNYSYSYIVESVDGLSGKWVNGADSFVILLPLWLSHQVN